MIGIRSHECKGATSGSSAPVALVAGPAFRQSFRHKNVAERTPVARNNAQVAAVFVMIAAAGVFKVEWPFVKERYQPLRCLAAERGFGVAFGLVNFRRVDVR